MISDRSSGSAGSNPSFPAMDGEGLAVIQKARRRLCLHEALVWASRAICAALAGLLLLLIFGTQIVGWQWLLVFPAACVVAGVYLVLRRIPSLYQVAQRVDRSLSLSDTLASAWFFSRPGPAPYPVPEAWRRALVAQGERLASEVDLSRAIPFVMPRAAYAVALLGVVASGLFALRYSVNHSMDLRPPLAGILQDLLAPPEQTAALNKRDYGRQREFAPGENPASGQDPYSSENLESTPWESANVPDPSGEENPMPTGGEQEKKAGSDPFGGEQEGAETGKESELDQGNQEGEEQEQGDGGSDGQDGTEGKEGRQDASRAQQQQSLSSRLKEAMANLLSKMRQSGGSTKSAGQKQTPGSQKDSQEGKGGQKAPGQSQQQQAGQQGSEFDNQSGSESAQDAQGKGSKGEEQAGSQPGSGFGTQDGNKEAKEAEQLAAMGKISEIIGKRAANVTGEITVEVQKANQQIRTPYSRRAATHAEAASDISRDEVPMQLQDYVQAYFEEVRKQQPAATPAEPERNQGPEALRDTVRRGQERNLGPRAERAIP
jgi:hypothetical protein